MTEEFLGPCGHALPAFLGLAGGHPHPDTPTAVPFMGHGRNPPPFLPSPTHAHTYIYHHHPGRGPVSPSSALTALSALPPTAVA